jgi:hypothetical protein
MMRADELFTMVPNRFVDAVLRGELTERQARLCLYIARHAHQGKGVAKRSLANIAADLQWGKSPDTLMRELKELGYWFEFDSKQGQRTPYLFRLTGLSVRRVGDELSPDERKPEPRTSAPLPHDFRKIEV